MHEAFFYMITMGVISGHHKGVRHNDANLLGVVPSKGMSWKASPNNEHEVYIASDTSLTMCLSKRAYLIFHIWLRRMTTQSYMT